MVEGSLYVAKRTLLILLQDRNVAKGTLLLLRDHIVPNVPYCW